MSQPRHSSGDSWTEGSASRPGSSSDVVLSVPSHGSPQGESPRADALATPSPPWLPATSQSSPSPEAASLLRSLSAPSTLGGRLGEGWPAAAERILLSVPPHVVFWRKSEGAGKPEDVVGSRATVRRNLFGTRSHGSASSEEAALLLPVAGVGSSPLRQAGSLSEASTATATTSETTSAPGAANRLVVRLGALLQASRSKRQRPKRRTKKPGGILQSVRSEAIRKKRVSAVSTGRNVKTLAIPRRSTNRSAARQGVRTAPTCTVSTETGLIVRMRRSMHKLTGTISTSSSTANTEKSKSSASRQKLKRKSTVKAKKPSPERKSAGSESATKKLRSRSKLLSDIKSSTSETNSSNGVSEASVKKTRIEPKHPSSDTEASAREARSESPEVNTQQRRPQRSAAAKARQWLLGLSEPIVGLSAASSEDDSARRLRRSPSPEWQPGPLAICWPEPSRRSSPKYRRGVNARRRTKSAGLATQSSTYKYVNEPNTSQRRISCRHSIPTMSYKEITSESTTSDLEGAIGAPVHPAPVRDTSQAVSKRKSRSRRRARSSTLKCKSKELSKGISRGSRKSSRNSVEQDTNRGSLIPQYKSSRSSSADGRDDQSSTRGIGRRSNIDVHEKSDKYTATHWKKRLISFVHGRVRANSWPPLPSEHSVTVSIAETCRVDGDGSRPSETTSVDELKPHSSLRSGHEQQILPTEEKKFAWILPLDSSPECSMVIHEECNDSDVPMDKSLEDPMHEVKPTDDTTLEEQQEAQEVRPVGETPPEEQEETQEASPGGGTPFEEQQEAQIRTTEEKRFSWILPLDSSPGGSMVIYEESNDSNVSVAEPLEDPTDDVKPIDGTTLEEQQEAQETRPGGGTPLEEQQEAQIRTTEEKRFSWILPLDSSPGGSMVIYEESDSNVLVDELLEDPTDDIKPIDGTTLEEQQEAQEVSPGGEISSEDQEETQKDRPVGGGTPLEELQEAQIPTAEEKRFSWILPLDSSPGGSMVIYEESDSNVPVAEPLDDPINDVKPIDCTILEDQQEAQEESPGVVTPLEEQQETQIRTTEEERFSWILPLDSSPGGSMVIYEESNDSNVPVPESLEDPSHEVNPIDDTTLEEQQEVSPCSETPLEEQQDLWLVREAYPGSSPVSEKSTEQYLDNSLISCHRFGEYPENEQLSNKWSVQEQAASDPDSPSVEAQHEVNETADPLHIMQQDLSRVVTREISMEGAESITQRPEVTYHPILSSPLAIPLSPPTVVIPAISHTTQENLSAYEQLPPQLLPLTVPGVVPAELHKASAEEETGQLPVTIPDAVSPETSEEKTENETATGIVSHLPLTLVEYMTTGRAEFAASVDSTLIDALATRRNASGRETVIRATPSSSSGRDDTGAVAGPSRERQQHPSSPQPGPSQHRYQHQMAPGPSEYLYQHQMAQRPNQSQHQMAPRDTLQALVTSLGIADSDDDPGYLSESSAELKNNSRQVYYPVAWQEALIQEPELGLIIDFIESSTAQTVERAPEPTGMLHQEQVPSQEGETDLTIADVESTSDLTFAAVQQSDRADDEQQLENRPVSASGEPHSVGGAEDKHEAAEASTSQSERQSVSPKKTSVTPKSETSKGRKSLLRRWREHQMKESGSSSDSDTEARRRQLQKQELFLMESRVTMERFLMMQRNLERHYAELMSTAGGDGHLPEAGPSGVHQLQSASESVDLTTSNVPREQPDETSTSTNISVHKESFQSAVCQDAAAYLAYTGDSNVSQEDSDGRSTSTETSEQ